MIEKFVKRWEARKHILREQFAETGPTMYEEVVKGVIGILHDPDEYASPDPNRIVEIDHGEYQGTLLYVIGADNYQPHIYWYVRINYGSCGACDTLQSISDLGTWGQEKPNDEQVRQYMILALHIVQGLREMGRTDA